MRRKLQPLTQQTDGGSAGKDTREFLTVSSLVLTVHYFFPFHEYIVLLETADLIKPNRENGVRNASKITTFPL